MVLVWFLFHLYSSYVMYWKSPIRAMLLSNGPIEASNRCGTSYPKMVSFPLKLAFKPVKNRGSYWPKKKSLQIVIALSGLGWRNKNFSYLKNNFSEIKNKLMRCEIFIK